MQTAEYSDDTLESYCLVKSSIIIDQEEKSIQGTEDDTEKEMIVLSACRIEPGGLLLVDGWSQTHKKGIICSSPFSVDCATQVLFDKCMDDDVVLLSACRRLDQSGILLIDAWTQTNTICFFNSYPKLTEDELSDEETLCDDGTKSDASKDPIDGNQIMKFINQKMIRLIKRMNHYIPLSSINYMLKLISMGLTAAFQYGVALFNRLGFS